MIAFKNTSFLLIISIFIQLNLSAQDEEWKHEYSEDGKIEVLSKISKESNSEGESIQVIEYVSTMQIEYTLEECIAILKNVDNHKDFYSDTKVSKKIKDISDTECLVYFYMDAPWPLPNSDCVSIMRFSENKEEKTAVFELLARPNEMEMKDVRRMVLSETIYSFQEAEDQIILFEMRSKFIPAIDAPAWMIKSWFPDGPIEIMENITALIQSQ